MSNKDFECQNAIFMPNSNVKIGFFYAKNNIYPLFECRKRHLNVELRYLASFRVSKWEFECLNVIFSLSSYVKLYLENGLYE